MRVESNRITVINPNGLFSRGPHPTPKDRRRRKYAEYDPFKEQYVEIFRLPRRPAYLT